MAASPNSPNAEDRTTTTQAGEEVSAGALTSGPHGGEPRPDTSSGDAEEAVRGYWNRVWVEGDLDALDELFADRILRHTSEGSETLTCAELRRRLAGARQAVRISEVSFDALAAHGASVWVRLTLRGVSLATSSPMTLAWMAQYRIERGRIAELWALHQPGVDWSR